VEQALSEVASSISSFTPRPGPQRAWLLQLQIWLLLAEIYLSLEQVAAATACIQEAASIFPLSHHIMYMVSNMPSLYYLTILILPLIIGKLIYFLLLFQRGLVHEYKQEFIEAKLCFQNAVAINPTHIKSLQHLVCCFHLF
jgi:tetratricopeptide (TPR) repeat protein